MLHFLMLYLCDLVFKYLTEMKDVVCAPKFRIVGVIIISLVR